MDPTRIVTDHLIWESICAECAETVANEPLLTGFLSHVVLSQPDPEAALAYIFAAKLDNATPPAPSLRGIVLDVLCGEKCIQNVIRTDLRTVVQRDPAAVGYANPLLYLKGFHFIQAYRVAYSYWECDRHTLALYLQSRISEMFAVDIHPAAWVNKGIMFDHTTSVVTGKTVMVEDDFSVLYEVTLGGPGKGDGSHHPKIGRGTMIGAGTKALGNTRVGGGVKIGAGSVVLKDVPPHTTVAGIPVKVVSIPSAVLPALDMDQFLPSVQ